MKHILTPFNGMHSGFNEDGSPKAFIAQLVALKRIIDFTPQDNASSPPFKFGYYQMTYNQHPNDELIQLKFTFPPNKNFTITFCVVTNVINSTFTFSIDGINQMQTAVNNGLNVLQASFNGKPTGIYDIVINPNYKMDFTTFLLTEIRIEKK